MITQETIYVIPVTCQSGRVWCFSLRTELMQRRQFFPKNVASVIGIHGCGGQVRFIDFWNPGQIAHNRHQIGWLASISSAKFQQNVVTLIGCAVFFYSWEIDIDFFAIAVVFHHCFKARNFISLKALV